MKAALRVAVATLVLTIAVGTGAVAAASPTPTDQPTVGGTLSVAGKTITVYSNGNVPAHITMSAESVTLSETSFDIQPYESHDLTFTGKADGRVTALYTTVAPDGGESGSASLNISLVPVPPKPDQSGLIGAIALLLLLVMVALYIIRRVKPWRLRVSRV